VGTLLIDEWLGVDAGRAIAIRDDASTALVRAEVRRLGPTLGLGTEAVERATSAASELARNQLVHAHTGHIVVRAAAPRAGVPGIEIVAADGGDGISDPTAALAGDGKTSGSLGVGLSAAYRLVDEMDADVRWGEGTCLWARTFASPLPRSELAILGRAHDTSVSSGDQAAFVRGPDWLVIAVVDGLGHGHPARAAADRAVALVRTYPELPPDELLTRCDAALRGTRGGVMTIVRLDLATRVLAHAACGNVTTRVLDVLGTAVAMSGQSRVLGARTRHAFPIETAQLASRQVLVIYTDGLSSRIDAGDLRRPTLVLAHDLVVRFGRAHDDAIVVVAR
jgi:anti-sigma regulatory factor (Ser/Thr protein kinase)